MEQGSVTPMYELQICHHKTAAKKDKGAYRVIPVPVDVSNIIFHYLTYARDILVLENPSRPRSLLVTSSGLAMTADNLSSVWKSLQQRHKVPWHKPISPKAVRYIFSDHKVKDLVETVANLGAGANSVHGDTYIMGNSVPVMGKHYARRSYTTFAKASLDYIAAWRQRTIPGVRLGMASAAGAGGGSRVGVESAAVSSQQFAGAAQGIGAPTSSAIGGGIGTEVAGTSGGNLPHSAGMVGSKKTGVTTRSNRQRQSGHSHKAQKAGAHGPTKSVRGSGGSLSLAIIGMGGGRPANVNASSRAAGKRSRCSPPVSLSSTSISLDDNSASSDEYSISKSSGQEDSDYDSSSLSDSKEQSPGSAAIDLTHIPHAPHSPGPPAPQPPGPPAPQPLGSPAHQPPGPPAPQSPAPPAPQPLSPLAHQPTIPPEPQCPGTLAPQLHEAKPRDGGPKGIKRWLSWFGSG